MIGNVLGIKEDGLTKTKSELPKTEDAIDVSNIDNDTKGSSFVENLETSNLIPDNEEEDGEEINFD
tara:strand:+ start:949 stop:1146 length:198 start_codon:yes stop_codon:yes gene_type:complete